MMLITVLTAILTMVLEGSLSSRQVLLSDSPRPRISPPHCRWACHYHRALGAAHWRRFPESRLDLPGVSVADILRSSLL